MEGWKDYVKKDDVRTIKLRKIRKNIDIKIKNSYII